MILTKYLKTVEKFTADNSPAFLSAVAIVGTISTAYLASKASFRAAEILREEEPTDEYYGKEIDTRTKVFAVWKEYIPATGTALLTVTCIVFSHRISTRRAAAMAVAYSLSDKAYQEYKEKVIDKLGENKERNIRDEIAQDRMRDNDSGVIVIGTGKVLCFDKWSGRYFESSMEEIKKAVNDTNYEIIHNMYCSLTDFYARIGLPGTAFSDEVGWDADHKMDVHFSTVMSDDQRPCLVMDFHVHPFRRYDRIH